MTYEARCILQRLKDLHERKLTPTRRDLLNLAHDIASGEIMRSPELHETRLSRMRAIP